MLDSILDHVDEFTEERIQEITDALSAYMPTDVVHCPADVDYDRWIREGVKGLALDMEGTFCRSGEQVLQPDLVYEITRRMGERGFTAVWPDTNKRIRSPDDLRLVEGWRLQIGGDFALTPTDGPKKPSPHSKIVASERTGIPLSQIGTVGDKSYADVRSGNFAGLEHIAWTLPLEGDSRHPADRFIMDPQEKILRVFAHLLLDPIVDIEEAKPDDDVEPQSLEELLAAVPNQVVGYGLDYQEISDEMKGLLFTPRYIEVLNQMSNFIGDKTELPREVISDFLYEHGRTTADAMVFARLLLAAGEVGVRVLPLISPLSITPERQKQIQAAMVELGAVLDGLDGAAARRHKFGPTKRGGEIDQRVDKILSASVDLFAILPIESVSVLTSLTSASKATAPIVRDFGMTMLRRPFAARGMDTKSVDSGKWAAGLLVAAQIARLTSFNDRYPVATRRLRNAALGGKAVSALLGPIAWVNAFDQKRHDEIAEDRLQRYFASLQS